MPSSNTQCTMLSCVRLIACFPSLDQSRCRRWGICWPTAPRRSWAMTTSGSLFWLGHLRAAFPGYRDSPAACASSSPACWLMPCTTSRSLVAPAVTPSHSGRSLSLLNRLVEAFLSSCFSQIAYVSCLFSRIALEHYLLHCLVYKRGS